jgi:hypothetical protein
MKTIFDLIEDEQNKMSWWDRFIRNYPRIHQTSFLSAPISQTKPEIVLRPSIIEKLFTVPFFILASVILFFLIRLLFTQRLPLMIPIIAILLLLLLLFMLVWQSFLNPKYLYKIRINHQFIEAHGLKYYWQDIADTIILSKMKGRLYNESLVIIMKDGKVEKLSFLKFRIGGVRMAGIIEFYKRNK